MGETRWVHMDHWSASQAELFYQQHRDAAYLGQPTCRPFHAIYNGNSTGPVDFQFYFMEDFYWLQNMKTHERTKMRRIEYVVTAPPALRTNFS